LDEATPASRETWKDYRNGQEFEHQLIDRKTSWFLTAQTILFAAYGLSSQETPETSLAQDFRNVTASSGQVLALIALVGVLSLVVAKVVHWRKYRAFFEAHRSLPAPYSERPSVGAFNLDNSYNARA
jgi:Na+-translocating ferredoxin:NAD+ oxidoreductase RnfD subunit